MVDSNELNLRGRVGLIIMSRNLIRKTGQSGEKDLIEESKISTEEL